jgi:GNAT superfamily N-acetyltransferase
MPRRPSSDKSTGPQPATPAAPLTARPVTPADWPLIEQLFGARGACGGCWCMSWRVPGHGKAWEAAKGEPNRLRLQELVQRHEVHAVLAFAGDRPVGWCSFGPRASFPRLMNSRALARTDIDGVWSVVCFFIPPEWRRQGVATCLLQAVVQRAAALGAREVEGIPAVPYGDGKLPAAFAWTGVPALFVAAGFAELRRKGATRPIYVKRMPSTA